MKKTISLTVTSVSQSNHLTDKFRVEAKDYMGQEITFYTDAQLYPFELVKVTIESVA